MATAAWDGSATPATFNSPNTRATRGRSSATSSPRRSTLAARSRTLGDAPGLTTPRFDSVDSDGAPGFILNEVNLRPKFALTDRVLLRSSINFAPRTGSNFALGDSVDVDLAEIEYVVTRDGKTSLFVGKMLPVFGIEYKDRKANQRFGITPSLVARYTIGSQLGLKLRSKLLNDWLIVAAAVTNNSSVVEAFHFASEIDKNWGKTLNGRLAVSIPIGDFVSALRGDRLELGVSGEWGPQAAPNNDGKIWFAGVDLQYLSTNYALKAQVLEGKAPGLPDPAAGVWGLDLKPSGYVEFDWQVLAKLGFLVRAGLRDALVTLGTGTYLRHQADAFHGWRACRVHADDRAQGGVPLQPRIRRHPAIQERHLHELAGARVLTDIAPIRRTEMTKPQSNRRFSMLLGGAAAAVLMTSGCDEEFLGMKDGFTDDQWTQIRVIAPLATPAPPNPSNSRALDDDVARLGQMLFFDPDFSSAIKTDGPSGTKGQTGALRARTATTRTATSSIRGPSKAARTASTTPAAARPRWRTSAGTGGSPGRAASTPSPCRARMRRRRPPTSRARASSSPTFCSRSTETSTTPSSPKRRSIRRSIRPRQTPPASRRPASPRRRPPIPTVHGR